MQSVRLGYNDDDDDISKLNRAEIARWSRLIMIVLYPQPVNSNGYVPFFICTLDTIVRGG